MQGIPGTTSQHKIVRSSSSYRKLDYAEEIRSLIYLQNMMTNGKKETSPVLPLLMILQQTGLKQLGTKIN